MMDELCSLIKDRKDDRGRGYVFNMAAYRRLPNSRSSFCILRRFLQRNGRFISSTSTFNHETSIHVPDWSENFRSHHIPTTPTQKLLLSVGASIMALYNPYRHDMVAVAGEATGYWALKQMHTKMMNDPVGKLILEEKPRINSTTIDFECLRSLPNETLGKQYISFMDKNNISADTRAMTKFVDDPELAYVIQRYREIHDFNHLLLGLPTNMLGEVVVKWFEMLQTGLPVCIFGAIFGPLRLNFSKSAQLMEVYLPWVIKTARDSSSIMNVYIERHFEDNFEEFKEQIGIAPLPIT
ncbi:ubiquinone biosynthesis protein COQ4 homolog, mitochondrial-like [Anneissia japonica]|uniref:ubiquinone biosynthesis protein COQ4 homolog, mitochondrial-like n=1 Tax=Anneissia japonica TaxID=1529436 RepID=UPI00142575A9|nr:ubiquinone biosynthesis protein COQ4 homolog, mitochondrial-like [Anneissia japonica]